MARGATRCSHPRRPGSPRSGPRAAPPPPRASQRPFVLPSPGTPVPEKFQEKHRRDRRKRRARRRGQGQRGRAKAARRPEVSPPGPRGRGGAPGAPWEFTSALDYTLKWGRGSISRSPWDFRHRGRRQPGRRDPVPCGGRWRVCRAPRLPLRRAPLERPRRARAARSLPGTVPTGPGQPLSGTGEGRRVFSATSSRS